MIPFASNTSPANCAPNRSEWPSLQELVERIRTGDPTGAEVLYKLVSRGLLYYFCRHVGPDVAEDHLHETLLIVLKAIQCGNLREPERLLGFVRTVARRRVASSIRDAAQERHKEAELRWAYETRDRPDDPENALLARQQSEIMQTVLLELSPRDREVLARFYLLEQSQGQICQEMGLTETQFRLTKSRAKARFSKLGKHKLCAIGCSASR